MLKTTIVIVLTIAAVCFASCARPAGNSGAAPTPSAGATGRSISSVDVVKTSPEEVTISRGDTADAQVRLKIDGGYHVNANPPSFPYLKATELELTPDGGLSVSFIKYPDPLLKKFSFDNSPLAVYEGDHSLSETRGKSISCAGQEKPFREVAGPSM